MINIFKENISFRISKREKLEKWIELVIKKEGFKQGSINFIFCSDAFLRKINRQYLSHDYNTDIVTFDNSDKKKTIEGDIFISVERIRANSKTYGVSLNDERDRVMIHGILHLTGYSDKNKKQKEKMTNREDYYLSQR